MKPIAEIPDLELLAVGNVAKWLSLREENLLFAANEIKNGGSIAKTLGMGGLALSLLLTGVNPMATIAALFCGVGYIGAVLTDKAITNSLAFFPFVRGNITDTLGTAFNAELRTAYVKGTEVDELRAYLPAKEGYELVMLTTDRLDIIEHLKRIDPSDREEAYFWQVKKFIAGCEGRKESDIKSQVFTLVSEDEAPQYTPALPLPPQQQDNSIFPSYNPPKQTNEVIPSAIPFKTVDKFNKEEMYSNTYKIRQTLIDDADQGTVNGAIIVAKPGAGKTTFIGTAWNALHTKYGDRFQSFALIKKDSDYAAFKSCSTYAYCVENQALLGVVEMLKFIDFSMNNRHIISRIFIDDFLPMQAWLKVVLKNSTINLDNYDVVEKQGGKTLPGYYPILDIVWAKLCNVWLVGREYNTALWVCSHSSGIEGLPFIEGGRDGREVGRLIYLAKSTENEFLSQVLNNANLIADNVKRQQLKQQMSKVGIIDEPIILSNANNWTFGIVPKAILNEYLEYRQVWENKNPAIAAPDAATLETFHKWLGFTFPTGTAIDDPKISAFNSKVNIHPEQFKQVLATLRQQEKLEITGDGKIKAL
jgi:hypothetical protein